MKIVSRFIFKFTDTLKGLDDNSRDGKRNLTYWAGKNPVLCLLWNLKY